MSSDLISRSALLEDLIEQIPLAENVHIFKDIIESQKIAYDPDKVVRKLELCQLSDKGEYKHLNMPIVKAIEIVKGGGVE